MSGDDPKIMQMLTRIIELSGIAEEAVDDDTYDQLRQADFDMPDDAEMWIQHSTSRKCTELFRAVDELRRERWKRRLAPSAG